MTRSFLRRSRIREVVPEVLGPQGAMPPAGSYEDPGLFRAPAEDAAGKPGEPWEADLEEVELENGEPEAGQLDHGRLEQAEAAVRAGAFREEAARAEAAAQLEAAQLEAALLEAAREEAIRAEEVREESARQEAALASPADDAEASPEAVQLEAAEPTAEGRAETSTAELLPPISEAHDLEPPRAEPVELICEISFWRGYRKAAFVARTNVDGEEVAVAESAYFRARGNGLPERTDEALATYNALLEQLDHEGWKPSGSRGTWFGQILRRELTVSEGPAPE